MEILIVLAITAALATLTVPTLLQSQKKDAWNAAAKGAATMATTSFARYRMNHNITGAQYFQMGALSPYLNFIKVETTGTVDSYNTGTNSCSPPYGTNPVCLRLHNGAILYYWEGNSFCNDPNTAIQFFIDPDGKPSDSKAVAFWIYSNGQIRTYANLLTDTRWGWGSATCQQSTSANSAFVPSWFSWD